MQLYRDYSMIKNILTSMVLLLMPVQVFGAGVPLDSIPVYERSTGQYLIIYSADKIEKAEITEGQYEVTTNPAAGTYDQGVRWVNTATADWGEQFEKGQLLVIGSTGAASWTVNADTTPPTLPSFTSNAAGDSWAVVASETVTVDCTDFTATMGTAGTVAFTGTGPCVPTTAIYAGDTGTVAVAVGGLNDGTNDNELIASVVVDNTANTSTAVVTDFIFTMRTSGADEVVTLPATGSNNFDIDWGDGSSVETVTTASPTHSYAIADDYEINISGTCPIWYFNNTGDAAKLISVSNLGDLGWTGLNRAFYGASSLVSFDFGYTDLSGVTSMNTFMRGATALTTVTWRSDMDVSSITDWSSAFRDNTSMASSSDPSSWDVSAVTTMQYTWYGTTVITDSQYDSMLTGWSALTLQDNVTLHVGDAQYTEAAARAILTGTYTWAITDGGAL